jgi:hypothetical protein
MGLNQGRSAFYAASAIIAALICAWIGLHTPIAFPLDDAYITLHNAQVLRNGVDINYQGTPALMGATSLVHLALVTGFTFVASPEIASFLVAAGAVILYVVGLARLAFDLGVGQRMALIAVLLGTLSGYVPYHLFNGLETGLALAAGVWSLVFALSNKPNWPLPVLCGLMPFIRPEFIALSALLMGRQFWLRRKDAKGIALDLWLVILASLPWLAWTYLNTGAITPATISAKSVFFAESARPFVERAFLLLFCVAPMTLVPMFAGFVAIPRHVIGILCTTFFVLFIGSYLLKLPGALTHNYYRYGVILAPFSVFGMICAAKRKDVFRWLPYGALVMTMITASSATATYERGVESTRANLMQVASWTEQNLPDDSVVLVHDAGYIAYKTHLHLVDVVGLKTIGSSETHAQITAPSNGARRPEAVHRIASAFHVTHAIVLNDASFWWDTALALKAHGWSLTTLRPARTIGDYAVFKLTPPAIPCSSGPSAIPVGCR